MQKINYKILNSEDDKIKQWEEALKQFSEREDVQLEEITHKNLKSINEDYFALVMGGDGSLNYAIRYLIENEANSKAKILYCPGGTGNDFSRAVDLYGYDLKRTCDLMVYGKESCLDIAKINQEYFVNVGSFGAFADVTPAVESQSKSYLGGISYYLQGFKKATNIETFSCSFELDGKTFEYENVVGFFVGNSCYCGAGVRVIPDADTKDGSLDLLIVNDAPFTQLVGLGIELQKEEPQLENYDVVYKKFKKIKFQSSESIPVTLDGEAQNMKSANIEIKPSAAYIMLPKKDSL